MIETMHTPGSNLHGPLVTEITQDHIWEVASSSAAIDFSPLMWRMHSCAFSL